MLVSEEFFLQGDLERARGAAAPTPHCDRATQTRVGLQLGFLDAVAGPVGPGGPRAASRPEAQAGLRNGLQGGPAGVG